MPQVEVDGLTINYDVQGEGEPLLLIPYTSADHACYAFQLPAYTEHFSCIAIDLPGSGESDKPAGPYSTEGHADQVAAFLGAIGIERAHVAGVSLGAAVGIHLAARHPGRVRSLSLHSAWHASDDYLKIVVEQWRTLASTLPTVADVVIQGIFPWCFTPEMYVERPEFVDTLVDFVRSRPAQPVDAFLAQTEAVIAHDASAALGEIAAPTLITFGARDLVCSTRFAEPLKSGIAGERAGGLRAPVARRAARGPRDLQPRDARLPAAPALVTPPPSVRADYRPTHTSTGRLKGGVVMHVFPAGAVAVVALGLFAGCGGGGADRISIAGTTARQERIAVALGTATGGEGVPGWCSWTRRGGLAFRREVLGAVSDRWARTALADPVASPAEFCGKVPMPRAERTATIGP